MLNIINTQANSVARQCKIPKGELIRFNNEPALDMLDVAYYDSMSRFSVTVRTNKGEITTKIHKDANEPLGLIFSDDSYLTPRHCCNKCIFCFVDQLPQGMRDTLYVKDDDWRLSFACGNYVTLTNVGEQELQRIITKKFSPLYISVHATDWELRKKILGNPRAQDIMPILTRFAKAGITMNTQMVLCPDINDGDNLAKSLGDLYSLYPQIKSVAIVPVGLTKYRDNLYPLQPYTVEQARKVVAQVEEFDKQVYAKHGEHFVYCSDEFYIDAELPIPNSEFYGDYDQIENGVGIVAQMKEEFDLALSNADRASKKSFTLLCGLSAEKYVTRLINSAKERFSDLNAEVVAISNNFFGDTITVSGLVTGKDIIKQLEGKKLGEIVLIPNVMLREIQDVFLDGVTLEELSKALNRQIIKITDGYALGEAVLEGEYL